MVKEMRWKGEVCNWFHQSWCHSPRQTLRILFYSSNFFSSFWQALRLPTAWGISHCLNSGVLGTLPNAVVLDWRASHGQSPSPFSGIWGSVEDWEHSPDVFTTPEERLATAFPVFQGLCGALPIMLSLQWFWPIRDLIHLIGVRLFSTRQWHLWGSRCPLLGSCVELKLPGCCLYCVWEALAGLW